MFFLLEIVSRVTTYAVSARKCIRMRFQREKVAIPLNFIVQTKINDCLPCKKTRVMYITKSARIIYITKK